jgi:aspartate-semialdehyde dehydrogenase
LDRVALLGGTGMVGRRFASLLKDNPCFELAMIIGSDGTAGKSYRSVWNRKETELRAHYGDLWTMCPFPDGLADIEVSSFQDLEHSDCSIIFSSIAGQLGRLEDVLVADGRVVFSNSPHRRFDPDVALIVPEVNGNQRWGGARLIKYPNCVSSGLVLILAPLCMRYGVRELVVTTYQSISGRGDAKYARELVMGNILPLHKSLERTEEYIRREVAHILRSSFPISVTCNRVCVQEGHFVEVKIKLESRPRTVEEVEEVLIQFNPLKGRGLHYSPKRPIVAVSQSGRPSPMEDAYCDGGMAVVVGNISLEDEVFDLRCTYVVNNLVRGAAGGVALSAELWKQRKCLELMRAPKLCEY